MRTIAEQWDHFGRMVLDPTNPPTHQRREMRIAFYAGAESMLRIVHGLGGNEVSEDAGVAVLEGLVQESELFAQQVITGAV